MTHPAADQARAAVLARRYTEAEAILQAALLRHPSNADLLCELALLHCLKADEGSAARLSGVCEGGQRFALLKQILSDHAYCSTLTSPGRRDDIGIEISACLIVKNEEDNLGRCLESLAGRVNEIVVVDTGSTDRTIEIAQEHNVVIGNFKWCDDFSAARNHALQLATKPWILWIDADEVLDVGSEEAIHRAVIRPHFGGYDIEIINPTDNREGGSTFTHSAVRLFRRHPQIKFTGRIHEQVCPSLELLGLPWARLEGVKIIHYGYRPAIMEAKGKAERTITLLEREVREAPDDAFQWFNLSMALIVANRFAEAENAARNSTRYLMPGAPFAILAFQNLVQAQTAQSKLDAALASCDEAEKHGFGGLIIDFERAQVLLKKGEARLALESIDRCLAQSWPVGLSGDRGIETHKRNVLRGQILAVLGRFQEALAEFEHALRVDPGFAPCHFSRGATLEKMNRGQEALESYSSATEDPSTRVLALKGTGRLLSAEHNYEKAAKAFSDAWYADQTDYESWVGWAGACEAWGNLSAIVEAYEEFAKVSEPTSDILVNWGRALEASGEHERALSCFTEAIKRAPEQANGYFNCGDLLYRLGLYHDAAHLYEAGLRHDPVNADGWFTLANCLAQVGLGDAAARMYEQALVIDPRHERARHNLNVVSEPAA